MTLDRISKLLRLCGLPSLPTGKRQRLHHILDKIDAKVGTDTTFIGEPCHCRINIGGYCPCFRRRHVGARVALLEKALTG